MNRTPLTVEKAQQLGGALHRLEEIGSATIIQPQFEAEVDGIKKYLASEVPAHINELLACWYAVHNEYEPLISGIAAVLRRAGGVNAQIARANMQQQQALQPTPEPQTNAPKANE